MGFPCKSFHQEFDTNEEIQNFAKDEFDIPFPLFGLIDCNGERDSVKTHPLYDYLTNVLPDGPKGKGIEWNFAKFLIDNDGIALKRFANKEGLDIVEAAITDLLYNK